MNSTVSLSKLMRQDLRQRTWMIVLSCIMQVLAGPIVILFGMSFENVGSYYEWTEHYEQADYATYLADLFAGYCSALAVSRYLLLVVAFIGAVIVSVWGFRHLYSRRMLDTYFSAPVKRSKLFLAHYLNGVLIWFVPCLIVHLINMIIVLLGVPGSTYTLDTIGDVLRSLVTLLACFFSVYNLGVLCACLSGTYINTIVNYILLGLDVFFIYGLFLGFCETLFQTFMFVEKYLLYACALSPLTEPIVFEIIFHGVEIDNGTPVYIILMLLCIVGNFLGARYCYINRPTEIAEKGMFGQWVPSILRIVNALLAGLFFAFLCLNMLYYENIAAAGFWTAFLSIFCAAFIFCLLEIMYQRSFRALFAHKWQLVGTIIAGVLIYCAFVFDVFHYDTYLPDQKKIASASITSVGSINGDYYSAVYNGNSRLNGSICIDTTDNELIYNLLKAGVSYVEEGVYQDSFNIDIRVNKTSGGSYMRSYCIPYEYYPYLQELVETSTYKDIFYPLESGKGPSVKEVSINMDWQNNNITLYDEAAQNLLDAYCADFNEHYRFEELTEFISLGSLRVTYDAPEITTFSYSWNRPSFEIHHNYTRTLAVLKELYGDIWWHDYDVRLSNVSFEYDFDTIYCSEENLPKMISSYFGMPGSVPFWQARNEGEKARRISDERDGAERQKTYTWTIKPTYLTDYYSLEPYFIIGYLETPEYNFRGRYVEIGSVTLYDDRTGSTHARVYVPAGCFPESFVKSLRIERNAYGEYDESIIYSYDTFYE